MASSPTPSIPHLAVWKFAPTTCKLRETCSALALIAVAAVAIVPSAGAAREQAVALVGAADKKAPTAPSSVTVMNAANSVSLSWAASKDPGGSVAGYGLYRNGVRIAVTEANNYSFTALTCGTSYGFGVDAFDRAGNRSATTTVIASTTACPDASPPSLPSALTQTASTVDAVSLSWAASVDNVAVVGYDVYLDGAAVGTTQLTTYTAANLACGRSYTFGVRSVDGAGNRSSIVSVTASTSPCPDTVAPTTPGFLIQSGSTASSVTLSWTTSLDNVGVVGYTVYVNGAKVGTTTTTLYTVAGLACGVTYTVAVDAYDAAGNRSSQASATGTASACVTDPADTTGSTLSFTPTADTRVEQAYPSNNFGSLALRADGGGDPASESHLRFAVEGVVGTVTSARLRLYATSGTVAGPTLHATTSSWSESSVTWNTRPSYAIEPIQGTGAIAAGTWVEFDVTPVVQKTASYSFALKTTSSDGVDFVSREGSRPPMLVVTMGGDSDATTGDTQAPSSPSGLTKTGATATSVSIAWTAATDNVGVAGYDVYVNGSRVGTTSATSYSVTGLACGTSSTFAVEAFDAARNRSAKVSLYGATSECPPAPTDAAPLGIPGSWTLKFSDEFNGTSVDLAKWRPNWLAGSDTAITKPVNSAELSCYDPKLVSVANGLLVISAEQRPCTANNGITYQYASGLIESAHDFQFTYGAFEARMRVPTVNGTLVNWPAFWANGNGPWPTTGEIDVVEVLSGTSFCWHFHYDGGDPGRCPTVQKSEWHTFAAEWQPGRIDFYYDGVHVGSVTQGVTDAPMYLIANLGISTQHGGPLSLPAKLEVDYIRFWQH